MSAWLRLPVPWASHLGHRRSHQDNTLPVLRPDAFLACASPAVETPWSLGNAIACGLFSGFLSPNRLSAAYVNKFRLRAISHVGDACRPTNQSNRHNRILAHTSQALRCDVRSPRPIFPADWITGSICPALVGCHHLPRVRPMNQLNRIEIVELLEQRHNQLLLQLDRLNEQVELVLSGGNANPDEAGEPPSIAFGTTVTASY